MTDHSDEEALGRLRALGPLAHVDQLQENVRRRLDAPPARAAWFHGRPRLGVWGGGLTLAAAALAATSFLWSESTEGAKTHSRTDAPQVDPSAASTPHPAAPPPVEPSESAPRSDSIQEALPAAGESKKLSGYTPAAAAALPRSNLLYRAATALRQDNDPSRSLGLLDEYVRASPAAARAEEVQALRMEAYYRLGSPHAVRLAEAYLKAFPQGRFRQSAQNISKQPGQSPVSP